MMYRAFTSADFDALRALDLAVQRREDLAFDTLSEREREGRLRTSEAALRFFERSEHSFVADDDGELRGAIFAQSVWQGDRPIVLIVRLWTAQGAPEDTARGLLKVCSKSAYDAAVYEVHGPVPADLVDAAREEGFVRIGAYGVRHMGTRRETAPGEAL
ncbi:DUF1999 domain-containing protein [Deinococcus yavapaiensis]|uniref:Uncharacterized protein DUF1999 n=1 Tax=Deinococcus yavapaiensis KR-236 TaxID=694435 RepID=A0A318SLC6_9DEIO|nr:DUF1999 domain-containing protein [Deinococcus yavapaiensis]PYE55319.1 uncharacterized protein DUF1999 [Deinococcus yavapaiensis KR-236]